MFYKQNQTVMNTTFRGGFALVVLLCTATNAFAQNLVQEDLRRADKQFDLYAYNLAIRTYESVLKSEPNNAHALARIADCYYQLNRPEESLTYYDRAVSQPNADLEVMLAYGKALMQTGDYIGAKKWFRYYGEGSPVIGKHYADMCDFAITASKKEGIFKVKNEPLNTNSDDYAPAFLGSRVVYNSARSDIERKSAPKSSQDWTGSAYNQLFVTQRNMQDGYLQRPEFLRSDLENNYNEGPASFSADGRRVAFCRNNFIDGTRQIAEKGISMSLYIADVVDGRWANEKSFPHNGSDFATGFPCLSPDGNTLYFASNQVNGLGGWDIYVSTFTVNGWSAPRNLGAPLNTAGNEVTPFFDGKNLYFASDRHMGLGGLDIFRADISDDPISNIFHLGPGINSARDDYGFIYSESVNYGYFVSNRAGGRGNTDIWQAKKTIDEFTVLVQDVNQNPIPFAEIDFTNCGAGVMQTDNRGYYGFAVAVGKADCNVTVRRAGYLEQGLAIRSAGEKNLVVTLMPVSSPPPPVTSSLTAKTAPPVYPAPSQPVLTASPPPPTTYGTQPEASSSYTLTVTDHFMKPINYAEIDLSTCGGGRYYTDIKGRVEFMFPATSVCTLFVNKNGYESVVVPVQPNTIRQFTITLNPIGLPEAPKNIPPPTSSPTPVVVGSQPAYIPPATLLVSQKVPETLPITYDVDTFVQKAEGYAIQLSAGNKAAQEEKVKQYEALAPKGNLYAKEEGNLMRIRLGVYRTRKEAEAVLPEARKYARDAFVVKETDVEAYLIVGGETQLTPAAQQDRAAKNAANREAAAAANLGLYFAVQVASVAESVPLRMTEYNALSDYGNLYAKPENEIVKVRVGVWNTYSEAEQAKNMIVARGFREAIVVTEKSSDTTMDGMLLSPKPPAIDPAQGGKQLPPKTGNYK